MSQRRTDVLVVAAHPPDLRGLRDALGEHLAGTVQGLEVMAKTVGIGMPVAGAGASRRVWQLSPRAVVLLGTCGVYPGFSEYRPHDVVVSEELRLVDPAVLSGQCAYPEPMQTRLATSAPLAAGLAASGPRAFRVPLACTLAMTLDDQLAHTLPEATGCHAESLESYAVAHACQQAGVPFAAVLGVSHVCGSVGRADHRRFERQSQITAGQVVVNWLHSGAQGLPHG